MCHPTRAKLVRIMNTSWFIKQIKILLVIIFLCSQVLSTQKSYSKYGTRVLRKKYKDSDTLSIYLDRSLMEIICTGYVAFDSWCVTEIHGHEVQF